MVDHSVVKKEVPPKARSKREKKKGPSRPQPAWLFPADEANPVLNPKEKSHAEVDKDLKDREKAFDYMKRRVHGVPDRPAPDPLLLTLIGIFLTDFGFNSTSRLFTNERKARQTLNGWEDALGKKIDKKTPKLEQIFRDWHRDWLIKQGSETSSSETSSSETSSSETSSGTSSDEESEVESQENPDEQSISDDSNSADSDNQVKETPLPKKSKKTAPKKKHSSPSPSLSSSSSDSDADDEKENAEPQTKSSLRKASHAVTAPPTIKDMVNKLKRKAPLSFPESTPDRSEDENLVKVKKSKTGNVGSTPATSARDSKVTKVKDKSGSSAPATTAKGSKSENPKAHTVKTASPSSSENQRSGTESDKVDSSKLQQGDTLPALPTASSDSSATINGDSKKPSVSASPSSHSSATSSSSEDSDAAASPSQKAVSAGLKVAKVKPHKGTKPTPLAEMSNAPDAKAHPSNKYQSYDYADKAYQDLSATRGKGFTKEKNKKKRGSYRGGPIDMSGGKSFKFDD